MSFLKGRVLCSEDDADFRELIVLVLKGSGYQVVCTEAGTQALDFAKNGSFDLFLVDNWMPGITGPVLTRLIREFNQTTPILFYSAAAFESDMQLAGSHFSL
jgi:CheY-like chemotaxis protein